MAPRTFTTIVLRPPQPQQEAAAGAPSSLAIQVARRVQELQDGATRAVESLAKRMNDVVVLLLLLAGVAVIVVDIYAQVAGMSERALTHGAPNLRRAAGLVLRGEWDGSGEQ